MEEYWMREADTSKPLRSQPKASESIELTYQEMLRENRSWGLWLLGLGVIHLVASTFLDSSWGILLLIVGLASFYFREAAMFVIYGVTLAWAGIGNLMGGQIVWSLFALFQFYLSFRVFRQFFHFNKIQAELTSRTGVSPGSSLFRGRASRIFPGASCLLGFLAVVGVAATFTGTILFMFITGVEDVPSWVGFVSSLTVNLAVLGLGISLASLLSKHQHQALTALGLGASAVMLVFWVVLALIG